MLLLQWHHTSQAACSSHNLWCFCITDDEEDSDPDAVSFYPTFDLDCYMKADKGGEEKKSWAWLSF